MNEILITNHIYPACRRTLEYVCEKTGAILREASIPWWTGLTPWVPFRST